MSSNRDIREENGALRAYPPGGFTVLFDDFITADATGALGWLATTSGTAAAVASVTTNIDGNHPGEKELSTGTTATGRATYTLSVDQLVYPAASGSFEFEAEINIPNLSVAGQRYVAYVGLGDNTGTGDQTDGVYFKYDEATTANWEMVAAQGGTRTTTATATAVATGFTKLKITCVTGTATFFINGTQVGTVTTNLPGAGQFFGVLFKIEKTVGTTARVLRVDYSSLNIKIGTPR